MFRILTKADILLFLSLVAIGAGSLVYSSRALAGDVNATSATSSERQVRITVANEEYGTYPLDQDDTITITRQASENQVCINIVVIENGTVHMDQSNCKNQVCVQDGRIDTVGQQIICLPNRVVIEIIGNDSDKAFDAIAQ